MVEVFCKYIECGCYNSHCVMDALDNGNFEEAMKQCKHIHKYEDGRIRIDRAQCILRTEKITVRTVKRFDYNSGDMLYNGFATIDGEDIGVDDILCLEVNHNGRTEVLVKKEDGYTIAPLEDPWDVAMREAGSNG